MDGLETAGIPARCEPARCEPVGHVRVREGDEMLVTTIHQAKGREWDVVIVGSLSGPDLDAGRVGASETSTGPAGITSPSPGQATCWCSPPAASHRPGSTPPGEGAARWPCLDRDHRTGGVDALDTRVAWCGSQGIKVPHNVSDMLYVRVPTCQAPC